MPTRSTASSASLPLFNTDTETQPDAEVRSILSTWKDLEPQPVDLYISSGVGKILIDLERAGFKCSEGDPLLLLCPDPINYDASMAYINGGNYALPVGRLANVTGLVERLQRKERRWLTCLKG